MKHMLQFAVAKYVPDVERMEPRNIGVVLWADNGATLSRFIGEQSDGSLRVPSLVEAADRHAFREWHHFWRHYLAAGKLTRRNGEVVERDSPQFLQALREKSKEQFCLADGGTFSETISAKDMERVLSELYAKIVERPEAQLVRAERVALSEACNELFETSGLAKRPDLQHDLPVPRKVRGVLRTFTADFALGPVGNPSAIFQRVLLMRSQSIDSNAFMFQVLLGDEDKPIERNNCVALVNLSQPLDQSAKEGLKMLDKIVPVLDVSKKTSIEVVEKIRTRAALARFNQATGTSIASLPPR